MKDPEFRREYEALREEYEKERARIQERIAREERAVTWYQWWDGMMRRRWFRVVWPVLRLGLIGLVLALEGVGRVLDWVRRFDDNN